MVRIISRQCGGLAALKLTKLFGINDFPAAKDSGKVVIIIIYCYLIIIIIIMLSFLKVELYSLWDFSGDNTGAFAVSLIYCMMTYPIAYQIRNQKCMRMIPT